MNRIHLCHVFPAFATGGPEIRTSSLIDSSADEYRHTVISLSGNLSGRNRIRRAEEVTFLDATRGSGQIGNAIALGRLLKKLQPTLVLTYGWGGTDAAAVARLSGFRRVIHTEDGFLPDESHRQKFKRVLVRRVMLRMAARVVVPSCTLRKIATDIWWLSPRRVCYFPNGIDTQRFSPASPEVIEAARQRVGCRPDEVVIGTVGHLREEKNQLRLLNAFATLASRRPARLLILGDGPLRETLVHKAHQLGLAERVHFTGNVSDTVQYYPAMDCLAMSSDTEQMPLAVLEAMGMGLPVVSTDVGDVKDMVSADNRPWVTPLGNEAAYIAALAGMAEDAAARERAGRANREKCVRDYRFGAMLNSYLDLFREVLAD
jgi:glycosyltransferase involved in cell wall biosynthesis